MKYYKIPVNPQPWAVGSAGVARRGGKMTAFIGPNAQLQAYQQAVKEELLSRGPIKMIEGEITLEFYFWRQLINYTTQSGRSHRKHQADGTNMMKATEDALQGVLFENDRSVKRGNWTVVEQGPDVNGLVVVGIESYVPYDLPMKVLDVLAPQDPLPFDDDSATWRPSDEELF